MLNRYPVFLVYTHYILLNFKSSPSRFGFGNAEGEPDLPSAVTLPFVTCRKWKEEWALSEPQASFARFPFFARHKREPEGQRLCGRLLLLTFLGDAGKVSSRRATPGNPSNNEAPVKSATATCN
ncbi:hypothetical protein ACIQW9_13650 [Herminiimonas sp. NPDC097707]|uniref:hypothetical protein n=1 Tax=Herminiimonas sp. NPDC097707 TaxID=3364007 RepID=UPI00383B4599